MESESIRLSMNLKEIREAVARANDPHVRTTLTRLLAFISTIIQRYLNIMNMIQNDLVTFIEANEEVNDVKELAGDHLKIHVLDTLSASYISYGLVVTTFLGVVEKEFKEYGIGNKEFFDNLDAIKAGIGDNIKMYGKAAVPLIKILGEESEKTFNEIFDKEDIQS